MDIKKEYGSIEPNCRVLCKNIELDSDFQETLPAYLDDIYRVVRCCVRSCITSADISFNEVKIFGKIEICLTYYNENSSLCYADFDEDFTKSLTVDGLSDNAFVCCDIDDKYANFRVINQRRIDIHTSSVIHLDIYDRAKESCISSCENAKLRTENTKLACVYTSNISKIEFDEEFFIPSDSPMIKRIVSTSAFASLTDTRVIKDKTFVKGTVNVSVLYTTDNDEENILKSEHSFNVSKIIDIPEVNDNDIVITRLSVGSIFVKAKVTSGDKMNGINVYGEVISNIAVIRESELSVVCDGYVLNRKTDCSYGEISAACDGKLFSENKQFSIQFDINSDIREIKDLSLNITAPVMKGGKLVSAVNMNGVCLTDGGELCSVSFSKEIELDTYGYENAVASIGITSFDYSISGNDKLDLRLNALINAYFYNEKKIRLLSDINASDEVISYPSLTVYFGKADENVWDIAKSFSSDSEAIMKENALSGDVLNGSKVLIIPRG